MKYLLCLMSTLGLENIQQTVIETYRQAQQDYMRRSNNKRLNTWHVSDFISECVRKSYYSKK